MGKGSYDFGPAIAAHGSEYKAYSSKEGGRVPPEKDPYVLRAIERVKSKFKTGCTDLNRSGKGS